MQGAVVIDDNGEAWALGAPRLRGLLNSPATDRDIADYAVRHLGFVLLRTRGRIARAELCPALVKPVTLVGVYYTLLDWRPQRILLSRFRSDGTDLEILDDLSEFAATVERDVEDAGLQRLRPAFTLARRSWRQLGRPRYARFGPAVALWGATRGRLPGDMVAFLHRYGLQGRASLVRNPANSGRLVYEYSGSLYSYLSRPCQSLTLIGQDIEKLPDPDYGSQAAESYYACLADLAPRVETVNAVMRRDDGRRVWSYYDRILLPWQSADGTRFVLGLSELRRRLLAA